MNELTIYKPASRSTPALYAISTWWLIAFFSTIYIIASWWVQTRVLHQDSLLPYILIPARMLVRTAVASLCLLTGLLITSRKLAFRFVFKTALVAQVAYIVSALIKVFLLAFFHPIHRPEDLQAYVPLSLYSMIGPETVPRWLVYPAQMINLFEIAYWLLLAAGLRFFLGLSFGKMFLLVLCSYGLALVAWMACIAFITLNAT